MMVAMAAMELPMGPPIASPMAAASSTAPNFARATNSVQTSDITFFIGAT